MSIISYLKNILYSKPKIIVILGQTSTGKSDLAVKIAQKFNGEIISADSRQVYKEMNLGSGKITEEEMHEIPHHMIDIINPEEIFSVHDFQEQGKKIIKDIISRKKIPIICGGTGFYIDSLIYEKSFSEVPPNEELRDKLKNKTIEELAKLFKEKYPKETKKIDLQNKIRVIRALEICEKKGFLPKVQEKNPYNILFIGLKIEKEELKKRIYLRLIKRINMGMVNEVKKLYQKGVSYQRLESFGLEYRHISYLLQEKITKEEMIENLYKDIVKFAKRQMTWFKRNKKIKWFNPHNKKEIIKSVNNFLS